MVVEIVISFAVMLGMAVILCVAAFRARCARRLRPRCVRDTKARGDIDGGEMDDPVEEEREESDEK